MNKVNLEKMTWQEVSECIGWARGVVLIPVGSCEQHGPHLPLHSDTVGLMGTVTRAAERAKVVVAPCVPWGNSLQHMAFPGTITLSSHTLQSLLYDIASSLRKHGFNKLVFVNGHGGNQPVIDIVAEEICVEDSSVLVFCVKYWELDKVSPPPGSPVIDGHAGSKETSVLLYLDPQNVNKSKFRPSNTISLVPNQHFNIAPGVGGPDQSISLFMDAIRCSAEGHFGDPTLASEELGERIIDSAAKALTDFLVDLKSLTLHADL